jgi:hypothetical protein
VGEDILKDVKEDHHFLLLGGKRLKNLHQLHQELESMEAHVYEHHVNSEKNDFQNWIKDVYQDEKLATALNKIKHRKQALEVIKSRIKEVKSMGRTAPPQKRVISMLQKKISFNFMHNTHKFQALAGLLAALFLVAFVGIGLKATSITGAAISNTGSRPFTFFGGILGVLFLLVVALYVINEKHRL